MLPDTSGFGSNVAVTKFGVGCCQEQSETLLLALMDEDVEACAISMQHPTNSDSHGFVAISTTKGCFPATTQFPKISLEEFLSTYKPYLMDPFLGWHGNFLDYKNSPLESYLCASSIVELTALSPRPGREFAPKVREDSERVYREACKILPQLKNESFSVGQLLSEIKATLPEKK